jgi:superfamily II DNA helicase RecQ
MIITGIPSTLNINTIAPTTNFCSHIFLVEDKFIVSKFISWIIWIEENWFNYELFCTTQIDLLWKVGNFLTNDIIIDTTDLQAEQVYALINFYDILFHYSHLLWYTVNHKLKISGHKNEHNRYFNNKKKLIKEIDYLPENLIRHSDHIVHNNTKIWTTLKQINWNVEKDLIEKLFEKIKKLEFSPTRWVIRFFLYHFFGYATFSEERQNTVNIGTIFEPEKFLNQTKYGDKWIDLREWGQFDIISSILLNKNTLWILSTGSGKSITFLLSGMLKPWISFIVAPLKSLIDDQRTNIEDKFHIRWITIKLHSGMTQQEKKQAENELELWHWKFFYCAPERLQLQNFINKIEGIITNGFLINQIIIDEAHCLSERWHDFRFAYLNISQFKKINEKYQKKIPLVWLTATASEIVKNDIITYLDIKSIVEESSLNRPNLSFEIIPVPQPEDKPIVIKNLLEEKVDLVLWNVGTLTHEIITPITTKSDGKFDNGWLTFTIYGEAKTGAASTAQSAEWIYEYLKAHFGENGYMSMYMWEPPEFQINACPKCKWFDITQVKWTQQKPIWVYFDNIEEKNILYETFKKYNNARQKFCQRVQESENCRYCNNSSCLERFLHATIVNVFELDPQPMTKKQKSTAREILKNNIQTDFKEDNIWLLIATKWFGMGIDKQNIRYVIHTTLSGSLESYYQEVGRAGRDKKHSHCMLLFSWPTKSCLEETQDLKGSLPCTLDPAKLQYRSCPKWLNTMCDIARQQIMIGCPIVIDQLVGGCNIPAFLHSFLNKDYETIQVATIPQRNQIPNTNKYVDQNILVTDILFTWKNIGSWFTHPLIEFRQLYLFYQNEIINAKVQNNCICITKPNDEASSGYEKLIYRLICLWYFSHYYKIYTQWEDEGWNIRFEIYINTEERNRNTVSDYLKINLEINQVERDKAFEVIKKVPKSNDQNDIWNPIPMVYENDIYLSWLHDQDEDTKDFRRLIYFTYDKVESWKKERLRSLYESIKDGYTTEDETFVTPRTCIKQEIVWRLTGLKEKDSEDNQNNQKKCNFCSWCVKDTRKFTATSWTLPRDEVIMKVNILMKKKLKWESLTPQEEEEIKQYTETVDREYLIKNLFNTIKDDSFDTVANIIKTLKSTTYDITPMIEKKLEMWTYNPRYYFLDWYYNSKRREERIQKTIEILADSKDKKLNYDFGQRLGKHQADIAVWEILNMIDLNSQNISYLKIWFEIEKHKIDEESLTTILLANKTIQESNF